MKTIKIKVYAFDELSEEAKQNAIDNYRNRHNDEYFWDGEVRETRKAFTELFNLDNNDRLTQDDAVTELTGWRLATYLWNNYGHKLWKGKWYSTAWNAKTRTLDAGKAGSATRYSKIILENRNCVLTGVCFDEDVLDPIYKFMDSPNNNTTFEELISECLESLEQAYQRDVEYQNSDEAIQERLEGDDMQYRSNGQIFN